VASELSLRWEPSWDEPSRRDRRAGVYHPYRPDLLVSRAVVLDSELSLQVARVERLVQGVPEQPGANGLEGLARFLLRSEAIASSRIEGLQVSAQQVALAEFAATEDISTKGFSANARLVANNIITLRQAAGELADASMVTVQGMCELHQALLPDHPHRGTREVQNWIGGSNWHPLEAEFVPPPPDCVPELMADLATYSNGALHSPLVQAALVHAQFETIHPFTDGNGRVGRALIHTVLTRRGLTRGAILPISLVLLTRADTYVEGLTSYRYLGEPFSLAAITAANEWITVFLDAVEVAVDQVSRFATELSDLRAEWAERHTSYRETMGVRKTPRADSAVARLLDILPEVPVVTARSAQRLLDVSFPAARQALEDLAEAGILQREQVDRGTTCYLARSVFDLLTFAERRLASTRWDTRESGPRRAVPAKPQ
jgi:Fic family protein